MSAARSRNDETQDGEARRVAGRGSYAARLNNERNFLSYLAGLSRPQAGRDNFLSREIKVTSGVRRISSG